VAPPSAPAVSSHRRPPTQTPAIGPKATKRLVIGKRALDGQRSSGGYLWTLALWP